MKPKHSPFLALKFRDFRLLWIGLLISRIGSEMQVVAILWHIYLLTRSPLSLGLIGLSRFLPVMLFSFAGGVAADKYDRKKVMVTAQTFAALFSSILAWATFSNHVSPILIYLLLAGVSITSAFDTPARQSLIPSLVPKEYFVNAVGLSTIMWQTAVVLGPSIAGFIIAILGVGSVYALNAVSYLAVIWALLLMRPHNQIVSKETTFSLKSLREGFSFVVSRPMIYSTMLLDFFATFFASATTLLPIFAKDILSVGPQGLGLLYAAPSLGAIVAGLFTSSMGHFKNQGKILISAVVLYGLATLLFGLSKSFYLSLFVLTFTGAGDVISTIIRNTIRQLSTPDHIRGRMVSINMLFFMGGPQLGEVEAGVAAAMFGAPLSVVIGGAGTILATLLLAVFVPQLRKYQGNEVLV